jgi:limonene-1,2-epoxide hydrolase
MRREEEIVRDVLRSWEDGVGRMKETWAQYCAVDVVWWNSARGSIHGVEDSFKVFDRMGTDPSLGLVSVRAPVVELLSGPGLVMVERSDDLLRADGSVIVSIPVTGVIVFEGETIVEWRDYADDWMRNFRPAGESRNIVGPDA